MLLDYCICVYICVLVSVCVYISVLVSVCLYIHLCVSVCLYVYLCFGVCVSVDKSEADVDRERSLIDQWVCLTEERNAVLVPSAGSGIPGAPADWYECPHSCISDAFISSNRNFKQSY